MVKERKRMEERGMRGKGKKEETRTPTPPLESNTATNNHSFLTHCTTAHAPSARTGEDDHVLEALV